MGKTDSKAGESGANSQDFKLDLGLDSLLKHSEVSTSESELGANTGTKPAMISSEMQEDNSELSEFARLAELKDWPAVLLSSERVLEQQQLKVESPQNWLEAQAWWIIAQIESESLPATVLAAPFEAMLDFLVESSNKQQSLAGTLKDRSEQYQLEASELLVKQAAARLARRFFSQGEMIAGMQLLSRTRVLAGDLSQLKDVLEHFTKQPDQLSSSEHRLYLILCKELGVHPKTLSHTGEADRAGGHFAETGTSRATNISSTSSKVDFPPKNQNSFIRLVTIIFLLLFLGGTGIWFWFSSTRKDTVLPLQLSKVEAPIANLESPKPAPLTKVGELDAVLYGLENHEKSQPSLDSKISQPKVVTTPISPATPKPRLALDTKGPIESDVIRDMRENKADQKSNKGRSPSIKVPGPSQAPRFESFPSPRVFEVNRATNLMLQPSLSSDAVAGLKLGDRIKVVGIAGYWLKVVSRQGRVAYVLAEDAEPR